MITSQAYALCKEHGIDGVMIGRGIFANPFLFAATPPSSEQRLDALLEHIDVFSAELLGQRKALNSLSRFYKAYLNDALSPDGLSASRQLRANLAEMEDLDEVRRVVRQLKERKEWHRYPS